jgi:hypothetical protein
VVSNIPNLQNQPTHQLIEIQTKLGIDSPLSVQNALGCQV